jgi:hypothetical protein
MPSSPSLKAVLAKLRLTVADTRKAKVGRFELPIELSQ